MDYEKMLERGLEKVPQKGTGAGRFVIPDARVTPAGAKTNIENFLDISSFLRREADHLQKFLLKELATSGELKEKRLTVIGRFSQEHINRKIELYMKEYVTCSECGKPDTKLQKVERVLILKCEACGAKHTVKRI